MPVSQMKGNLGFLLDMGEQLSLSLALALVSFPLSVTIRVFQEPQLSSDKDHCSYLEQG